MGASVGLPVGLLVADGELVTEGPLVGVLDGLADLELDKVVATVGVSFFVV